MKQRQPEGLLLGGATPLVTEYSPQILQPIPRNAGRAHLPAKTLSAMHGVDVWHAYELSWLDADGRPQVRVGRFAVPAVSANLIESKSLKLYFNSLNQHRFRSEQQALDCMLQDMSEVAAAPIQGELFCVNSARLTGAQLGGQCIDQACYQPSGAEPKADLLQVDEGAVSTVQTYHSHLLRSLCPVTAQPDWASVWVQYEGKPLDAGSLLSYILSYRQHQEFHEQCVERIFCDLMEVVEPETLQVQALYTRRGGLDINPYRSTSAELTPLPRLNRQ